MTAYPWEKKRNRPLRSAGEIGGDGPRHGFAARAGVLPPVLHRFWSFPAAKYGFFWADPAETARSEICLFLVLFLRSKHGVCCVFSFEVPGVVELAPARLRVLDAPHGVRTAHARDLRWGSGIGGAAARSAALFVHDTRSLAATPEVASDGLGIPFFLVRTAKTPRYFFVGTAPVLCPRRNFAGFLHFAELDF